MNIGIGKYFSVTLGNLTEEMIKARLLKSSLLALKGIRTQYLIELNIVSPY